MKHVVTLILSIGWMTTAVTAETQASPIRIWAVDPLVKDFDKYQLDLSEFRATRRELLECLSRVQEPAATTAPGK